MDRPEASIREYHRRTGDALCLAPPSQPRAAAAMTGERLRFRDETFQSLTANGPLDNARLPFLPPYRHRPGPQP